MKKKTIKYILSFFALFVFLFSMSSCGKNDYLKGGTCGDATVDGTNTYSKIRIAYCEQFVYDYEKGFLDVPFTYTNDDSTYYDFKEYIDEIDKKYTLNENNNLVEVKKDDVDSYKAAHYLFYFMDSTNQDNSLVENYVKNNVSNDPQKYLILLDVAAYGQTDEIKASFIDKKRGYFNKINDLNNDSDDGAYSYKSYNDMEKDKTSDNANNITNAITVSPVSNRMSSHSKACIVFTDNFVDPDTGVIIDKMSYKEAWGVGFFNGLLIYPMAWFINLFVVWFGQSGWACVGAILIVTIILKLLVLLITFKSQASTQKMQDIQPEVQAIQAKYGPTPSPDDKQRMAYEMMAVYKKYGVKPFAPFVSLIITFPIFIGMWRAVSGLGILRKGSINGMILGNNLSTYIIGNFNYVALIVFILMAISQILSMKLPQIISRRRMSKEQRDQQKQAGKQMGMVSNVMMIMILVMGFTMPVMMSIYWIASALVGLFQSLIMHYFNNANRGKSGRYKVKTVKEEHAQIPKGRKV